MSFQAFILENIEKFCTGWQTNTALMDMRLLESTNGPFPHLPVLTFERNWVSAPAIEFCKGTIAHVLALSLLYCFAIFAGRRYMEGRKPYNLRFALASWNLLLAIFSCIGSIRTVPPLLNLLYNRGAYVGVCADPVKLYDKGHVGLWITLFIFSKIPELFDTLFIVLRKKPLIFLHWYHHVTVLLFCWHAFASTSASGISFAAMNYSVHAVMYFYYFLVAIGMRPRWARFVTTFQLCQMVVGVTVCGLNVYYTLKGIECHVDSENLKWAILMYSSYFALFFKFYVDRYFLSIRKKV
ncbi:unnamed protein product [Albugo candida]|uniref:Elongation of fatty acids protein n=3 Tax=Albugo candida TaxID=65357 RepID=A0A024G8W5_9STRA|nr:unnamed protein product [Albugo candida]|eukprot:CCI42965.1 unnamed protein product [Albugo candida]